MKYKKYRYIQCNRIEQYNGWEIIKIIEAQRPGDNDMVVLMKEDIPVQDYIKLNEATDEQLLEELSKRLNKGE